MEGEQGPSSASLCCLLQRRLRDRDVLRSACAALSAELDVLERELCAVAHRQRLQRHDRMPTSPPPPTLTTAQRSALTTLLTNLVSDPDAFADVLVKLGVDDDLADAFAHDLMPDDDASAVIAAVGDVQAARRLTRAVAGRVPVRHLAAVVDAVANCDLDLFNESDPDTVAYVGAVCDRVLTETTALAIPATIARLAVAAQDTLTTVFVDWIGAALKQSPDRLCREPIGACDSVNLIVIADTLAAVVTSDGHQSATVAALRHKWQTPLASFTQMLQYAAPVRGSVVLDPTVRHCIWTVRAADIARIAHVVQPGVKSPLASADPDAYVTLRANMPDPQEPDSVGSDLIAYLRRRSDLVECPGASLADQLRTDTSAGPVCRLLAVLHRTVPPALALDDFRPLLAHLLEQYDGVSPAVLVAASSWQLDSARAQLRRRTAAVSAARPVVGAMQRTMRRFIEGLRRVGASAVCTGRSDDGALICAPCHDVVQARCRRLLAFTKTVLQGDRRRATSTTVAANIRSYIVESAVPVAASDCHALVHVLDRLAILYPTMTEFRAAFGGPLRSESYDEADFDEVAAELGQVGDGSAGDWARIASAHALVAEIVSIGTAANANVAADLIATLAFATVKGRAHRLGATLVVLGAIDGDVAKSKAYMHVSVALHALFTMRGLAGGQKAKPCTGQKHVGACSAVVTSEHRLQDS